MVLSNQVASPKRKHSVSINNKDYKVYQVQICSPYLILFLSPYTLSHDIIVTY